MQVLCLRERVDHPQVLATNRHVSCGGVDLRDVRWAGDELSGRLQRWDALSGILQVTEPPGWEAVAVEVEEGRAELGERVDPTAANGIRWRRVLIASVTPAVTWKIRYRRVP